MYGIIDIGSNTMRLSCYRMIDHQLIPVFHKKCMAGLASFVDEDHCLSGKGIKKAIQTLEDFKNIVQCVGLDCLYVIATASFRNVENTDEIVRRIQEKTGMIVEVISGKQEALYDFKGSTCFTENETGLVVDIGGGSTELVPFEDNQPLDAASIPIGSLNTFTNFVDKLFPSEKEQEEIRKNVKSYIQALQNKKEKIILGVGGTNRGCKKLYNDYYELEPENDVLECEKVSEMLSQLLKARKKDRNRILKIIPDRIHTILPGLLILEEIMKYFKAEQIQISDWGVREGYLMEKLL